MHMRSLVFQDVTSQMGLTLKKAQESLQRVKGSNQVRKHTRNIDEALTQCKHLP